MEMTEQQYKDLEGIYREYLMEGISLITYIGEKPQCVKDEEERYYKKIRDKFGEDSELTKYLTTPRTGFIQKIMPL